MRIYLIGLVLSVLYSANAYSSADGIRNSSGLRVDIDSARQRQTPKTDSGTVKKAGVNKAAPTSRGLAAPFIPGGAVISAAVYSPQLAQSQRLKLNRVRDIIKKNRHCQAYSGVANKALALINILALDDAKLASKNVLKNRNLLLALKRNQKKISGKFAIIKAALERTVSKKNRCSSKPSAHSAQYNKETDRKGKLQADAQFKLALRILTEHTERQSQVIQKITS